MIISREREEGGWNQLLYGYKVSFGGDENLLELDRSSSLYNIVNVLRAIKLNTLKMVNLILGEFYFSNNSFFFSGSILFLLKCFSKLYTADQIVNGIKKNS